MKAIVKETGEVVDVNQSYNPADYSDYSYFNSVTHKEYSPMELDLGSPSHIENTEGKCIDWEQRRFDLAKCAIKSLLKTTKIQEYENSHFELDVTEMAISDISVNVANEIIKKLKEMDGVK